MGARAVTLLLALSLLAGSLGLVGVAQSALSNALVARAVTALSALTSVLRVEDEPIPAGAPSAAPAPAAELAATKSERSAAPKRAPTTTKPAALFVSAASVLALAKSRAEPRGTFVSESPHHPAGLRLTGVAALGIGAEEGDILIEALGIAPRSSGQIIGAIIEARARRARYLTGTLWRRGQTVRITVEQPYEGPA